MTIQDLDRVTLRYWEHSDDEYVHLSFWVGEYCFLCSKINPEISYQRNAETNEKIITYKYKVIEYKHDLKEICPSCKINHNIWYKRFTINSGVEIFTITEIYNRNKEAFEFDYEYELKPTKPPEKWNTTSVYKIYMMIEELSRLKVGESWTTRDKGFNDGVLVSSKKWDYIEAPDGEKFYVGTGTIIITRVF